MKNQEISFKKKFLLFYGHSNDSFNNNEPLYKLIIQYKEIERILEEGNKINIFKLLFFSKKTIHNILYNDDQIINIKYEDKMKRLDYNFYLNLLIKDCPEIINYSYSIEFIKKINNETNLIKDK